MIRQGNMINKNRIKSKRKKNITNQSEKFRSLAPVTSEIKFNRYRNMFKTAFSKKYIANIAVTGPYASGKSSIIQACKEQYGDDKFITLSLTNFNNNETDLQSNIIIRENKEEDLEAQLINQLIHKIDSKKIEESRFLISHKIDSDLKNIKDKICKNKKIIFLLVSSITILLLSGDMFANTTNLIEKYFSKYINIIFSIFEAVKLIAIFIIAGIVIKFFPSMLYQIISLIKKNKFRRINLYGNEIELFTSDDTSIFDKHTDEILYLFENAGVNYFIFEDIDRYEDVTVFKKLREINILLNDKRKRENKPLIKFIYLICDNMFTAEERTKFFDFIIPVVPFIHKGNSYDYMIKQLFPEEAKNEKNKKFLIKISLFIDNARILKNIANEYYIYNKFIHLKDREPHTKFIKLLSLIIYKNLFPKDFNLLYFNKGYLAELFNKEAFLKIVKLEDFTKYTIDNEYSIIGEENPDDCLIIFKEHIKDDITVAGILNRIYDKNIFYTAPKGYDYIYNGGYFDLIKLLIKNSYIDETYKDYMSEIPENSLTYAERTFLQNIFIKDEPLEELKMLNIYEKRNLDNLKSFLEENDYQIISILNIDFFLSLLKFNDYHKLNLIINVIKENKKYDFILKIYLYMLKSANVYNEFNNKYFDTVKELIIGKYEEIKYYFKGTKNKCNELFYQFMLDFITIKKDIFINKNEYNFIDIISEISIDKVENDISNNTCYTIILNKINNLFIGMGNNYKNLNVANIIHALKDIGIKFMDIQNIKDKDILKDIVDYYMFQPTYNNIVHILKEEDDIIAYPNIEKMPYNSLIETKHNDLKKYVDDNITYFLKSYPEEIKILEDRQLLNILCNSDKITEEDREELKTRFHLK